MADPHTLEFLRISSDALIALDNRTYHFALQPYHHLVRLVHIISVSVFFGAVVLMDFEMAGVRKTLPLQALFKNILPWLYGVFAVAIVSGAMLFFYDPLHVGSHTYFSLKMLFIVLALANALAFRGLNYRAPTTPRMATAVRIAGGISLLLWLGVMVCASLNVEAAPKVLLQ